MSLSKARSSVSMQSLPNLLARLGVSLAMSTHQSGRLILLRAGSATTEGLS